MTRIAGELEGKEALRKSIHVAFGAFAFAVPVLGAAGTALLLAAALVWNAFLLPCLGGRRLWRREEQHRGASIGMVAYPAVLLVLTLLFCHRLEVVAATWAVLAFGDGAATLVGRAFGGAHLPWNPAKTWTGSLANWVCGTAGAAVLLEWTLRPLAGGPSRPFLWAVAVVTALLAAFLESQPQRLDDNLTVPPLVALALQGLLDGRAAWTAGLAAARELLPVAGLALAVNLALGLLAHRLRAVDLSGLVAGVILGTASWLALGWQGFALLMTFVALGTGATRLGYGRKQARRLAQEHGGRRGAKNAVANTGVAVAAAIFAATTPRPEVYIAAFAAALAAAASDTLSSEIGQLGNGRTVDVLTFKPARPGVDGAISAVGTAAGIIGAAILSLLGLAFGLYEPAIAVAAAAAGLAGNLLDSVLGATLERRGLLDNEGVNFLATLGAAVAGASVAGLC